MHTTLCTACPSGFENLTTSVSPEVLARGGARASQNLGVQLTLFKSGEQIKPTTVLLAHPDLKT